MKQTINANTELAPEVIAIDDNLIRHRDENEEKLADAAIQLKSQTLSSVEQLNNQKPNTSLNYRGRKSTAKGYRAIRCQFF